MKTETKQIEIAPLKRGVYLSGVDGWREAISKELPEGVTDDAINTALEVQAQLHDAWNALDQIRQNKPRTVTVDAHFQKVNDSALQIITRTGQRGEMAFATLKKRRAEIENEVIERLGIQRAPEDANEIRAVLRSMAKEKRREALMKAVNEKDGDTLAAVIFARELTTGVARTDVEHYRQLATAKHAPDLMKLRKAVDMAEDMLRGAFNESSELYSKTLGDTATRSKVQEAQRAADEAALMLANTLGRS